MSVAERASTVLMPGFWGYDADRPTSAEAARNQVMHGVDSAGEALAEHPFGGVFLRPEVIAAADQVDTLTGELHEAGDRPEGLPLLVSIDQEGGVVQRLKVGVPVVPSAASVGLRGDPSYARQVARENGLTLRRLGVTMVMAPVADVDPDGRSVMGSRTYSPDRDVAARMVTATVKGYLQAGVIPVVKHFPGLGSVSGDSHHALPEQGKSLAQLRRTDLVTFTAAIDAGAPVVMTGHVAVDAVEPGMPGSISAGVVTGLLRDTLGFDGVAVTDSQGMGPINGPYNSAEGAVRSILAGDDLVLNSPYPGRARRALVKAVRSGRLPTARLDEAAARVLALRLYQQRIASGAGG
jgi:beta-N-acetylhexosaminidase